MKTKLFLKLFLLSGMSVGVVISDDRLTQKDLDQQLLIAVEMRDVSRAAQLLDQGARVNTQDRDGNTPIMRASLNYDDKMVQLLLETEMVDFDILNNAGQKVWHLSRTGTKLQQLIDKALYEESMRMQAGGDFDEDDEVYGPN